jgi:hypothetical protein
MKKIIKKKLEKKVLNTSSSLGVTYDSVKKYYKAGIKCNRKTLCLGSSHDELECAKRYNQQAMYLNSTLDIKSKTKYALNEIPDYVTVACNIYQELKDKKLKKK